MEHGQSITTNKHKAGSNTLPAFLLPTTNPHPTPHHQTQHTTPQQQKPHNHYHPHPPKPKPANIHHPTPPRQGRQRQTLYKRHTTPKRAIIHHPRPCRQEQDGNRYAIEFGN